MGIIRGGLLVIVSVFLFIGIFAGILLFTMSWSLNYSNVKDNLGKVVNETLREELGIIEKISDDYMAMKTYCYSYSNYVVTYGAEIITIPCEDINQSQEVVVNNAIGRFVEQIYFQNYDCEFWTCFREGEIPFFLVSAKAQTYWYDKFNYVLMFVGLLSILGFLLSEKKSNFFLLISALIIIASLPFMKIGLFIGLFGDKAEGLLSVFFSKGYDVFIRGVILGVVLLLVGIILKFFRIGFKIHSIFSKAGQELEKEETKESGKEEKKMKKEEPEKEKTIGPKQVAKAKEEREKKKQVKKK